MSSFFCLAHTTSIRRNSSDWEDLMIWFDASEENGLSSSFKSDGDDYLRRIDVKSKMLVIYDESTQGQGRAHTKMINKSRVEIPMRWASDMNEKPGWKTCQTFKD